MHHYRTSYVNVTAVFSSVFDFIANVIPLALSKA